MSIFANAIKGFIGNLLLKPLDWKDCGQGYLPGTGASFEGYCFPDLAVLPDLQDDYKKKLLEIVNPGANPQDIVWKRFHQAAEHSGVANASNCPPNTYPFNGSCLSHCPTGYVERAYPDNDPDKLSKGIQDFLYECVAECSQAWHPLTWDAPRSLFTEYDDNERNIIWTSGAISFIQGNIQKYKQLETQGSLFCYHDLPKESDGLTFGYSRTPFNIQPYEIRGSGVDSGIGENKFHVMHEGLYGERGRLALGAPRMAGSCPPPNVAGDGVCFRPTPAGMELIGNQWFTKTRCPTKYSIALDGEKQCAPKSVERGKYPSILQLLLYVIGIALIILTIVKVLQYSRR